MKLRFFNMIEVLLALGISAVGITGIMGIIPLGLKANRDAMAATFAADIANSLFAQLDMDRAGSSSFSDFISGSQYLKHFKPGDTVEKDIEVSSYKADGKDGTKTIRVYQPKSEWNPDPDDWKEGGKIEFQHKFNDDGIDFDTKVLSSKYYLRAFVGKKDGDKKVLPDFVADVRCWTCFPNDIPTIGDQNGTSTGQTPMLLRVYLEVSWPVYSPYEDREKRIFVREFYDVQTQPEEVPQT